MFWNPFPQHLFVCLSFEVHLLHISSLFELLGSCLNICCFVQCLGKVPGHACYLFSCCVHVLHMCLGLICSCWVHWLNNCLFWFGVWDHLLKLVCFVSSYWVKCMNSMLVACFLYVDECLREFPKHAGVVLSLWVRFLDVLLLTCCVHFLIMCYRCSCC